MQANCCFSSPLSWSTVHNCSSDPRSFPIYDGSYDPSVWIRNANAYFSFHHTPVGHMVDTASFHLQGRALDWFWSILASRPSVSWSYFVYELHSYFRSTAVATREQIGLKMMSTSTAPLTVVLTAMPSCTPDLKRSCTSINISGSNGNGFAEVSASQSMMAIGGAHVIAQKNISRMQVDSVCIGSNASLMIFQDILDDDEVSNKVYDPCDSLISVKNAKDMPQSISTKASELSQETKMTAVMGFEPLTIPLNHNSADEHFDVIMTSFGSNDFKCQHQGQPVLGGVGNHSDNANRTNGSSYRVALIQASDVSDLLHCEINTESESTEVIGSHIDQDHTIASLPSTSGMANTHSKELNIKNYGQIEPKVAKQIPSAHGNLQEGIKNAFSPLRECIPDIATYIQQLQEMDDNHICVGKLALYSALSGVRPSVLGQKQDIGQEYGVAAQAPFISISSSVPVTKVIPLRPPPKPPPPVAIPCQAPYLFQLVIRPMLLVRICKSCPSIVEVSGTHHMFDKMV